MVLVKRSMDRGLEHAPALSGDRSDTPLPHVVPCACPAAPTGAPLTGHPGTRAVPRARVRLHTPLPTSPVATSIPLTFASCTVLV